MFLRSPQRYPARDGAALVPALRFSRAIPVGVEATRKWPLPANVGVLKRPKAERWFQGLT